VGGHASKEKIEEFKENVRFLEGTGVTQSAIGEKMPGVKKTNFSKYYNEENPITNKFLAKFYKAWAEELAKKPENKNSKYGENQEGKGSMEETSGKYGVRDIIVEKLVDGQNRLINNNMILTESIQKLIDFLVKHGFNPDSFQK
jgi:hypothetical protein